MNTTRLFTPRWHRSVAAATLLAVALLGSGCASIVHNSDRRVEIASVPAGAKATVSRAGQDEVISVGTTPYVVTLDPKRGYFKGQSYTLRLELDGYAPAEVELKSKLSGWYLGNIVFGGLIGMLIVDPATGAMWNIAPEKIEQPLTQSQADLIKSGDGFVVVLASAVTDGERAAMVRVN